MTVFSVAADSCLVEEHVLTLQAVGRANVEARADLDLRAELRERVDVRIEPAPADHVSAGRRDADRAEA
jgi:hypothetical protein